MEIRCDLGRIFLKLKSPFEVITKFDHLEVHSVDVRQVPINPFDAVHASLGN